MKIKRSKLLNIIKETVNASKNRVYEDVSPFEENIQDLEEAELLLQQVIELIIQGVRGTNQEAHANAYIIPHLESWISPNSPETSISEYIQFLRDGDLEEGNITGTGASMNTGQGSQYGTPKAFKKKNTK